MNQTRTDTENNTDKKPIASKWEFKMRKNNYGEIERYQDRLCARGFTQVKDVDIHFCANVPLSLSRTLLEFYLAWLQIITMKYCNFTLRQDFCRVLEEDICMEISKGEIAGSVKVCKLNKSRYELRQSSSCCDIKVTNFLKSFGIVCVLSLCFK